ncbi:MAG: ethanolamine ammonia lyase-activating protein [Chloroflexi bacterium]|nr:ethanolamine ammonia lyase-activating protein [Chloroflexota bacterium]
MRTKTKQAVIPAIRDYTGFHRKQDTAYQEWLARQGVPVTRGMSVHDLNELPVGPWGDSGVLMNVVSLPATGETSDLWVMEIPPGGQLRPLHHMIHAMVFVLRGRGATSVWTAQAKKQTFEWHQGSLFAIPLNAWYEHFNGSGAQPARLAVMTNAPLAINMYPRHDFLFDNPAVFPEVYDGQEDYFSSHGEHFGQTMWKANFIADVRTHETDMYQERGAGGTNMHFSFGSSFLTAHISEFEPGTYKKGHRHGPGPHVLLLSGRGYSLTWADRKERYRIDWQAGTVYVPPNYWYHQHFNPHAGPARYLALTFPSHLVGRPLAGRLRGQPREPGDQIEYRDEDPWVMEQFARECERNGTPVKRERMTREYEESVEAPRVELM